ncbi:MAG: DUF465 domain-containing protein [Rhodobacteraceae bacterium]|nr:DUF465 domain-containing protein [Paracoccaceae bacterium]
MTHTPHELAEEFPDKVETIHRLKMTDAHFARLAEEYHAVNRLIHRAEQRIDLMSEEEEEHLRRRRAHLKDQIARHLA